LIDAGVETYTRHTFGPNRYDLWTMQSSWHSLPAIERDEKIFQQMPGERFAAKNFSFQTKGENTIFSLDIAGAYAPESGLKSYRREWEMRRGGEGKVFLREEILLEKPARISLYFLLIEKPEIISDARVRLKNSKGDSVILEMPAKVFSASFETKTLTDPKIKSDWNQESLFRLTLKTVDAIEKNSWAFSFSRE
jgi:hypothetical protein